MNRLVVVLAWVYGVSSVLVSSMWLAYVGLNCWMLAWCMANIGLMSWLVSDLFLEAYDRRRDRS